MKQSGKAIHKNMIARYDYVDDILKLLLSKIHYSCLAKFQQKLRCQLKQL